MTTEVSVPSVEIEGVELDVAPREVTASLSLHRPSRVVATYADTLELSVFDGLDVEVGHGLDLLVGTGATRTKVFSGDVVAIGLQTVDGLPTVRIEAAARSHRLEAAYTVTTFTEQTVSDIVGVLAGNHRLRAKVECRAATAQTYSYLLQTQSDAALLDRLARRTGAHWWVDGDDLHFRDRATRPPVVALVRDDVSTLRVEYDGSHVPKSVEARSWDPDQATGHVGRDAIASARDGHLGSTAPFLSTQYRAAAKGDLVVGGTRSIDPDEAGRLATAVASRLVRRSLLLEVETGPTPAAVVGDWVELSGIGSKLSGDYLLTDVEHRFSPTSQVTTVLRSDGRGGPDPLADLADDVAAATSSTVVAQVTDTNDAEGLGRVKLKFPSLGDQVGSAWARVVSPGAGPGRGLDVRPQVDDVVAVVFEHGDTRFPIVVGGAWTTQNPHADPDVGASEVERTSLRSRTGASLVFFDAASQPGHEKEGVDRLVARDNETEGVDTDRGIGLTDATGVAGLLVSAKGLVGATKSKPIVLSNGKASLKLKADGTIELEGKALKITLQTNGEIKASQKLDLEGAQALTAKSSSSEVKLGVKSHVKSAGMLDLKGAQVKIN